MSLLVNSTTSRIASALNRAGLTGVNRLLKGAMWKLSGDNVTVTSDGLRISGTVESWSTLSQIQRGALEPFETALFKEAARPGMVIVDVGANIGWYTLLAARRVGTEGKVFAFEPDPRTSASLKRNIVANGFDNVTVIGKAASDVAGHRTLFQDEKAVFSGLSASAEMGAMVGEAVVETVRIDEIVGEVQVDVIKMDIEGHESSALEGMTATLGRNPEVQLFLEFNPAALTADGTDPVVFSRDLTSTFREVSVIDDRRRCLEPFHPTGDEQLCNLLCRGYRGLWQ